MKKMVFILYLIILSTNVQAKQGADWDWHYGHRNIYRWNRGEWLLGDILVSRLVIGAVIDAPPPKTTVIYNDNILYYYDGTYYYQPTNGGYIVVPPPTMSTIVKIDPMTTSGLIPKYFVHVKYRSIDYFVYNNKWFISSDFGLTQVPDPTRI